MKLWNAIALSFALLHAGLGAGQDPRWLPDLEYGRAGDVSLRLDACVPAGEGPFPVAVLIHGGGWGSGDKRADFGELGKALSDRGIAWLSINYRLAPAHRWPACLEDVTTAIRWVRKHGREHRCDPGRLALVGYSAGGQLAALAAIRTEGPQRVAAVVGLAPAVELVSDSRRRGEVSKALRDLLDLPAELDAAALAAIAAISPAEELRGALPPFLIVQGTADRSVTHEDAVVFAQRLTEAGGECRVLGIEGAPHRIAEWPDFDPDYARKAAAWLAERLGKNPPDPHP